MNIKDELKLEVYESSLSKNLAYHLVDLIDYAEINDCFTESVIKNKNDILYNKKAFDEGKINLCFITGFAGSGKSTMSRGIDAEIVDMDKIIMYHDKPDEFFENEADIMKAFIKGPGKKYRITAEERMKIGNTKFDKAIIKDLLNFVKQYAASHKNQRFIMDGAWIYLFIEPAELRNYAVYIKGTSALTSASRAAKRGSNGGTTTTKFEKLKYGIKMFGRIAANASSGRLQKYQNYFGPLHKKQLEEEDE